MIVEDKSYEGYCRHMGLLVRSLPTGEALSARFDEQMCDYFDDADPVKGAPQLNATWLKSNARYGYWRDIPGLISEIISQYALSLVYGEDAIVVKQDKETQSTRGIDFEVWLPGTEIEVQSKTICFRRALGLIEKSWARGEADWVAITDIENREVFILPMGFIRKFAGKEVSDKDMEAASIHYYLFGLDKTTKQFIIRSEKHANEPLTQTQEWNIIERL